MFLKRICCFLVSGIILLGDAACFGAPLTVFADKTETAEDYYNNYGYNPDRITYDHAPDYDNITALYPPGELAWEVQDDTLYLTGSGYMPYYFYDPPWYHYQFQIRRIVIGEGVRSISCNLFSPCENLEIVELPDSMEIIMESAFQGCYNLKEINLPEGLRIIQNNAFADAAFEELTLPDTVEEIGNYAFSWCSELKTVHLSSALRSIGAGCFADCRLLAEIDGFPDTLSDIGAGILNGCTQWYLKQINGDEDFIIVGDGVLLSYVGDDMDVVIPDNVKYMSPTALHYCMIEGNPDNNPTEYIYSYLIPDHGIQSVTFPESMTIIPEGICADMINLKRVTLPETIKVISREAFRNCRLLAEINIPDDIGCICNNAFSSCPWIDSLPDCAVFGDGLLFRYRTNEKIIRIPEGVKVLCEGAVTDNNAVEIYCPESLRRICENGIFCRCLIALHLNDSLDYIEPSGIAGSSYLESVYIPESLRSIVDYTIDCPNLQRVIGKRGTAAEEFAELRVLPLYDAEPEPELSGIDMTLHYDTDVWHFDNTGKNFGRQYYLTERDEELVRDIHMELPYAEVWNGACFGMAVTVILAKNGMLPFWDVLPDDGTCLADILPTAEAQSLINYYHSMQYYRSYLTYHIGDPNSVKFYRMLHLAENVKNGQSPFIITFKTSTFSHAVVVYGVEYGDWQFLGKHYDGKVLIWDPNFAAEPLEECNLFFDSATYDYCIPHYDVYIADDNPALGLMKICDNPLMLNPFPYPEVSHTGDLTLDSELTVADAVLMQRWLLGDDCLSLKQLAQADLNGDQCVNAIDLTLFKLHFTEDDGESPDPDEFGDENADLEDAA